MTRQILKSFPIIDSFRSIKNKVYVLRNIKHKPPETFLLHLGKAIRIRRLSLFLSQEQLGTLSNLHRTYITDVENGLRNVSIATLLRITKALNSKPSSTMSAAEDRVTKKHGSNFFEDHDIEPI